MARAAIRALSELNLNDTGLSGTEAEVSVNFSKLSLDDTPIGSPGSDGKFKVLICFQWLPKKKQKNLELRSLHKNFTSKRTFTLTVCKMVNVPKIGGAGNSLFKPVLKVTMLPEDKQWWSEQPGEDNDASKLYQPFEYYTESLQGKTIVIEIYNRKITRHGEIYGTLKIRGEDLPIQGSHPVQRWFQFEGDEENDI